MNTAQSAGVILSFMSNAQKAVLFICLGSSLVAIGVMYSKA
jgi:GMP synthase-like glutamine amidotransferase